MTRTQQNQSLDILIYLIRITLPPKSAKMTVEISRGGGGKGKKSPVRKWELGKAIFGYWRKESLQFTLPYWFSGKIAKLPSAHWPREVL